MKTWESSESDLTPINVLDDLLFTVESIIVFSVLTVLAVPALIALYIFYTYDRAFKLSGMSDRYRPKAELFYHTDCDYYCGCEYLRCAVRPSCTAIGCAKDCPDRKIVQRNVQTSDI